MKNKPDFVTFTGADELEYLPGMEELSRRYPVEWGILVSSAKSGMASRYPGLAFFDEMRKYPTLSYSMHICGSYGRQIIGNESIPQFIVEEVGLFDRFQINAKDTKPGDGIMNFVEFINSSEEYGKYVILQTSNEFYNTVPEIDLLLDRSGGRGKAESNFIYPNKSRKGGLIGFAGGFGPEYLPEIDYSGAFWIDMENNVRTNEKFDLDKCESVLKQIYN